MTFEGLRGYAQAANDLSSIARARLLESVREAVRSEVERAGTAVGLASGEELAVLRRTVDRLQRRVTALESALAAATGEGAATPVRPAAGGDDQSAPRPARRPSAARSRATGRTPVGGRPPAGTAPHRSRPSTAGAPEEGATTGDAAVAEPSRAPGPPRRRRASSTTPPPSPAAAAAAEPTAEQPAQDPTPRAGRVTPVRRPRKAPAAAAADGAAAGAPAPGADAAEGLAQDAGTGAAGSSVETDGQNSGGRP